MLPIPPNIEEDLARLVERALSEDVGSGDVTTLAAIPAERDAKAQFLAKSKGILAGLAVAERVFATVDPELTVSWTAVDGDKVDSGRTFGSISGPARSILTSERVVLNFMQRMSGIATATHKMAAAAHPARILDTRKTAPGLRLLDKWAVRLGGGQNHRTGLFDMVLIKDNHIAASGGIEQAIVAARSYLATNDLDLEIEIETRSLEEVEEVLRVGGVDRVLLDNMVSQSGDSLDTSVLSDAVQRINRRFQTEASGNVTIETVSQIAKTGVDFISSGALTHSVRALDISLDIMLS
ncbi:MAG: carboxylating nicotinate-nucleotide diphosphorylase [Rubricoccaceae bacterium]|nr:carboxylating nicotinate-nucleotide diphosphorylase [Rubricoccaceae bacterium]